MTTITLHYKSPANDPHKVPRPHRVEIDADGNASTPTGGEIGPVTELLGFSRTEQVDFRPGEWYAAEALYDGDVLAEQLIGWRAAFMGSEGPFTYQARIAHVEIT